MSSGQLPDDAYRELVTREARWIFTEDDLLWYKLKPHPGAELDFSHADRLVAFARGNDQRVMGAHLVWDEGFGDGWRDEDLWGLSRRAAERLLYGTARAMVRRYRGQVDGWIVANEVTGPSGARGLRTDVPWFHTIGASYVEHCFRIAHQEAPRADLVLNEFGFETVDRYGNDPVERRRAVLQTIDRLLERGAPVHTLGVQAHLLAHRFADRFDACGYRRFLAQVAERGLRILITELDVLDTGLPGDRRRRDAAVADTYRRYLDVALAEPALTGVLTFGLADRYSWLEEDFPRADGRPRRPLPFDRRLRPKPAYDALHAALRGAR